jgi:lipoprotein-anchoring transpeptidase ErfK/SrfK
MPRSRLILIVVAIIVPIVAFGSLAYAGRTDERIAKGVTVDGVPVGDMSPAEARRVLAARLETPAKRPITVRYGDRTFRLQAGDADVRLDLDGALAQAQAADKEGSFLSRGWRNITGGELDRDVGVAATADRAAVARFVGRLKDKLGRPAKDAQLELHVESVSVTKSKKGRRLVGGDRLELQIVSALRDARSDRSFTAKVDSIRPKVTRSQIYDRQPVAVTVSKSERKVRVFKRGDMVQSYSVAVGSAEFPTPEGQFDVQTKQVNPVWSVPNSTWAGGLAGQTIPGGAPNNPLKARWIGINGSVGFHGSTDVGGSAASHGCIRMIPDQVIDLYKRVEVGTPVLVAA